MSKKKDQEEVSEGPQNSLRARATPKADGQDASAAAGTGAPGSGRTPARARRTGSPRWKRRSPT